MNNLPNTNNNQKIWQWVFVIAMGLQAVLELVIGCLLLFNLPATLETGFGVHYTKEWDFVGLTVGLYLLLLTGLMILSIYWTTQKNYSGVVLGIIIGVFLMAYGIGSLIKLNTFQGIFIDGIRGLLTVIVAVVVGKNIHK
jgi:hypothetical protein